MLRVLRRPSLAALDLDRAFAARLTGAAIALAVVVIAGAYGWDGRSDGALVSARVVENLLDGHGLAFNAGDRWGSLPGLLHPLTVALLALAGFDPADAAAGLGLAAVAVTAVLLAVWVVPGRGFDWGLAAAAAAISCATASLAYRSVGVDMPLALALLTGALAAWRFGRDLVFGVLAALAVATRLEMLLFVLPLLGLLWWRRGAVPWRAMVPVVVAPVACGGAWLALYGSPLPDVYGARVAVGDSGLAGASPVYWTTLRGVLDDAALGMPLYAGLGAVAAVLVLAYALVYRFDLVPALYDQHTVAAGRATAIAVASGGGLLALAALSLAVGLPATEPDLLPFAWGLALVVPTGCVLGLQLGRALDERAAPVCWVMAAVLGLILPVANLGTLADIPSAPDSQEAQVAAWLAGVAAAGDCSVASARPGAVGTVLACRVVDPLGRVTPGNARRLADGDLDGWLAAGAPAYVVTGTTPARYEQAVVRAAFDGTYEILREPRIPGRRIFRATGAAPGESGSLLGGDIGRGSPTLNESIFTVGGVDLPGLFMHAAQTHRLAIDTPAGAVFSARLGIADGAAGRTRGVTFILSYAAPGSAPVELLRQVVVPGAWVPVSVSLPGAGPAELILRTEVAPGGTTEFAWAVWGAPRLVAGR
jgi:hypothetical protein